MLPTIHGNRSILDLSRFLEDTEESEIRKKLQHAPLSLAASIWCVLALDLRSEKESQPGLIDRLDLDSLREPSRYFYRGPTFNADREFRDASYGFWPIRCAEDVSSDSWLLFRDRFRIAISRGSQSRFFFGLAGLLHEMADNVPSHAFCEGEAFRAMAGYHIGDDCISFSIADMGGGFLKSLVRSKTWSRLGSEREAIEAVIKKQATSRAGEQEGGGFKQLKQLFNTLIDMNGLIYLRSGNCLVEMRNRGNERLSQIFDRKGGRGAHITVTISRKAEPKEISL